MKYLFIDDSAEMLESLQMCFVKYPNVAFSECHNVEEALQAVATYQPDVLFLDHHLDEECKVDDGFVIADRLKGGNITIYSTTTRSDKREAYKQRGIECVGKTDLAKYRSIISSVPEKEKAMQELTVQEAKGLIERVGPPLGCAYPSHPVFPEGRKDV